MATATNINPLTLSAEALLAIKLDAPEYLFAPDAARIAEAYRALVKKWHPDRNKTDAQAQDVFDHIRKLRDKAQEKIAQKTWQEVGAFTCVLVNGKTFRVRSDRKRVFELGIMHIAPTTVTYVVDKANDDLFSNAVRHFGDLKYADAKMQEVYAPCLPVEFKTYETATARILTIRKGSDYVLLRDLLPFLDTNRDRHAAWLISRLTEMARYFDNVGLTHNGLTADTVFVSPKEHKIAVLGGWWYAARTGEKLRASPPEAEDFIAVEDGKPVAANPKTDLEMIRALGREILGDRGGTSLAMKKAAPDRMLSYLRTPSSGNAQKDLTHWYQKVLPESFGARRFTELKTTYSDIYQPGG